MILRIRKFIGSFAVSIALLGLAQTSQAQSNFGAVRGIVTDGVGASIDKASVTLISDSTKIARTTVSNSAGEYVFSAVDPGTYTVTVVDAGFKKLERENIVIESGNTNVLDLGLQVGATTESVEVTASEPLVDTGTSYGGQLIDAQKLQNLPNPGRNPFLFAKLENSVTATGDPRFVRFQDQSGSSTISISGAPMSSNNYLIDGVPITDFSNRAVIIPSIESVEEVKVQANTYDAEIGRTSGGNFNTTLRSGSSALARCAARRNPPNQLGREHLLQQPQLGHDQRGVLSAAAAWGGGVLLLCGQPFRPHSFAELPRRQGQNLLRHYRRRVSATLSVCEQHTVRGADRTAAQR